MAVAHVSPAHQNSVSPALKGPQNVVGGYRGRAHDPNRTNIARVLHATHARQITISALLNWRKSECNIFY